MSDGWKRTLAEAFGWIGFVVILAVSYHYGIAEDHSQELRKLCIEQKGSWIDSTCLFTGKAGEQ
jgi:hypothetical protein